MVGGLKAFLKRRTEGKLESFIMTSELSTLKTHYVGY